MTAAANTGAVTTMKIEREWKAWPIFARTGHLLLRHTLWMLLAWGSAAIAASTTVTSTLKSVYPLSDGSFVLIFTNDASTCVNSTPKYFYITPGQNGVSVDGAKAMLATSLSAFALGASVTLNFDDSTAFCYGNRLYIQ